VELIEKRDFAQLREILCNFDPPDIAEMHRAGWTDEAIYDAINVCGLFNFYNRWIDASGVCEMPEEAHRQSGKRLAERGYVF